MARARKDNGIYYTDFRLGERRVRVSLSTRDPSTARSLERKMREELEEIAARQGPARQAGGPTVREVVDEILNAKAVGDPGYKRKEGTETLLYVGEIIGMERRVGGITRACVDKILLGERIKAALNGGRRDLKGGGMPIERYLIERGHLQEPRELSHAELEEIADELRSDHVDRGKAWVDLGSWTVKSKIFDHLFKIINHVEEKHFAARPRKTGYRFKSERRLAVLTYVDEARLKAVIPAERWQVYLFAIESMMRNENIRNLRWNQVDFVARTIKVTQKGRKALERRITKPMLEILRQRFGRHPEFVFTWTRGWRSSRPGDVEEQHRIGETDLNRHLRADLGRIGVQGLVFHDFRRTGATRLYDACKDIRRVTEALGHSDEKSSWRYIGKRTMRLETCLQQRELRDTLYRARAAQVAEGLMPSDLGEDAWELAVQIAIGLCSGTLATVREVLSGAGQHEVADLVRNLEAVDWASLAGGQPTDGLLGSVEPPSLDEDGSR